GKFFPVCVLGNDPFGSTLDATVAGEFLDGKPMVAHRILSARDASGCRILFISASEKARMGEVLRSVRVMPMLTVSDAPRFLEKGGMIQLTLIQGRVRFEVNLGAAESAGLKLSSELLKVAASVTGKNPTSAR
ncbi:MAG: YfiR family protein, partial [Terriglobia bacterium]